MPPAATWMDSETVIWSKVSQRKTNTILYHLYMEPKKMIQMNLFTKARTWKQPKCPLIEEWVERCGPYIQWAITQHERE